MFVVVVAALRAAVEDEYDDQGCFMGDFRGYKRFNAPNRLSQGWLTAANVVTVSSGEAAVVPIKANGVVQAGSTDTALVRFGPPALANDSMAYYASLRTTAATLPSSYDTQLSPVLTNRYGAQAACVCVWGGRVVGGVWERVGGVWGRGTHASACLFTDG